MRCFAVILALVLGLTLLAAHPASAAVAASAENRASGLSGELISRVGDEARLSDRGVRENISLGYDIESDDAVAARGGLAAVRAGQAGEAAVRAAYDIGPKTAFNVLGRTRIADGLTATSLSEVKNVGYQAFTRQLRDSLQFSLDNELQFNLFVRPSTTLSGPLQDAVDSGLINRLYIPQ